MVNHTGARAPRQHSPRHGQRGHKGDEMNSEQEQFFRGIIAKSRQRISFYALQQAVEQLLSFDPMNSTFFIGDVSTAYFRLSRYGKIHLLKEQAKGERARQHYTTARQLQRRATARRRRLSRRKRSVIAQLKATQPRINKETE